MFAMRYALLALLTSLALARPGWGQATTFCQINIPLSCVGTNGWGPIVFDNWYGAGSNAGLCMNRMFSYYAACSPTSAPDSVMPITASFYSGSELIQTNSFSPTPAASVQPALGHNAFDLFLQYQGRASGGDGSTPYLMVDQAMARKRMADARNMGATFLRVSVTGWAPIAYNTPGDLTLWQVDPPAYWALMDRMMNDLDSNQLKLVPVFLWNLYQFPAIGGDTILALITDPNSNSYGLLTSYIEQFVTRYKDRQTIAFYELTNELNLSADVDNVNYCLMGLQWPASVCAIAGNFTTDQMIAFTANLATEIKSLDPLHKISSGHSLPRPAAQHLRANPMFGPNGADWTRDTVQQLQQNMMDIHQGLEIMSVHFYNNVDPNSGLADTDRFGITDVDDSGLLEILNQIASHAGKFLYVGEYGDQSPPIVTDPTALFSSNILTEAQTLKIPFSSPWILEFYQSSTLAPSSNNIEPGYTDAFITKYRNASASLGTGNSPLPYSPQVVVTWPLAGSRLSASQLVYAVASAHDPSVGRVSQVEFRLDDASTAFVGAPPFTATLNTAGLATGPHTITAIAYDSFGYHAQYSVSVSK